MYKNIVAFFAIFFVVQSVAQTNVLPKIIKTFPISGEGAWDCLAYHAVSNRLFISHNTLVNIINADNGDSVGAILKTDGVQGIAFADEFNKGYTTNSKTNTATVFNLKTLETIATIATGNKPDALVYDGYSKKIFIGNEKSDNITVIDVATDKVVATIKIGGRPRALVTNKTGLVFISVGDKEEIAIINTASLTVEKSIKLFMGAAPTGLAIDILNSKLFVAVGQKRLVVVDIKDIKEAKIIEAFLIGDGCDGVAFNPRTNTIYASNGDDGTLTIITKNRMNKFDVLGNVLTQKSARTLAINEQSNLVFLAAATIDETKKTKENKRGSVEPNSFKILVVGK